MTGMMLAAGREARRAARRRAPALYEAGFEGCGEGGAVEVFSDEDEGVGAGFGVGSELQARPCD